MAYVNINPNPKGVYVGDCVIRAIATALGKSWNETYIDLCIHGYYLCDMPSSNKVWGDYLKSKGYKLYAMPDTCPVCYTVKDFAAEYFKGTYILGTGTHVVTVIDGNWMDSWNSADEHPIYFWTKEEL